MALESGARLGTYEVLAPLGAGGMGEVYRARDTRLGRSVAIKVLPDAVAQDADRISRFEREAKALAALNHHHIATLHGLEESQGRHFLVMELVEGETLEEKLCRGPLAVPEAIRLAREIAEALEAAHENGIVHRDLKPANVKITPDEKIKVLDFGLAKALAPGEAGAHSARQLTQSPTLSVLATGAGIILGTAAYMSPEQAKGHPADHRSDVFSFGCVLYEMLTARQPFQGETIADILASVLAREPEWTSLPPNLNPRLPLLLKRCLEKSRRQRWQAIGDVRAELEAIGAEPLARQTPPPVTSTRPLWKRAAPVAAAAILASAITAAVFIVRFLAVTPSPVVRFSIPMGEGQGIASVGRRVLDVSADGSQIVRIADGRRLYLRPINSLQERPIPGAEGFGAITNPAFSPDGQSIAFYASSDRTIKRIAVAGGAAVTICASTTNPYGMEWHDDTLLFGSDAGIMQVSANGGQAELLMKPETNERLANPRRLADDVITASSITLPNLGNTRIVAYVVSSGDRKVLMEGAADARYVSTGHLIYGYGGVVFARAFDPTRLAVTGGPVPVIEGVRRITGSEAMQLQVSKTGVVAFVPGPVTPTSAGQSQIALVEIGGSVRPLKIAPGAYGDPRVSPDGKQLAYVSADPTEMSIWIYDLSETTSARRLTFGGINQYPIWSADGQRITFQSNREGDHGLFWQRADGTGPAERLTKAESDVAHIPNAWSPDGETLLFDSLRGDIVSLMAFSAKERKIAPYGNAQATGRRVTSAVFSPDGKWVAYTGAARPNAIYVQPFPATGAKYQVSPDSENGHHPVWSPSGSELYYTPGSGNRLSVTSVSTKPVFAFAARPELNRVFRNAPPDASRPYDLAPATIKGSPTFVAFVVPGENLSVAERMDVIVNWFDELKTRVPRP